MNLYQKNQKCCKMVENHPVRKRWHEKSIRNNLRMIRLLFLITGSLDEKEY